MISLRWFAATVTRSVGFADSRGFIRGLPASLPTRFALQVHIHRSVLTRLPPSSAVDAIRSSSYLKILSASSVVRSLPGRHGSFPSAGYFPV